MHFFDAFMRILTKIIATIAVLAIWFLLSLLFGWATFELLTPYVSSYTTEEFDPNWFQRNAEAMGWVVGLFVYFAGGCFIYAFIRAGESDGSGCNKSCLCPKHPWNQSSDDTDSGATMAAGLAVGIAVGVAT